MRAFTTESKNKDATPFGEARPNTFGKHYVECTILTGRTGARSVAHRTTFLPKWLFYNSKVQGSSSKIQWRRVHRRARAALGHGRLGATGKYHRRVAHRHSNHVWSMPASHLMRGALITFEGVMSDIRVTNMVCS